MKRRVAGAILAAVALGACGVRNTDEERIERVTTSWGQECTVVRSGVGKVIAIDCDWSER